MKTRITKLALLLALFGAVSVGIFHVAATAKAQTYTTTTTSSSSAGCLNFTYNMGIGMSSGEVLALQNFLNGNGYMSYPSTGYYGSITSAAVMRFQAANGISNTGFVGPLTRAQISVISCNNVPPTGSVSIYNISPSSGPVGTVVTLTGFGFTANNVVHFAGGAIGGIPSSGGIAIACTTSPSCVPGIRQTLSFTIPSYIGPYCAPGTPCPMYASRLTVPGTYPLTVTNENGTSNSVTLTITDGMQGAVSIQNVSPNSASVGTTVTISGTNFTDKNTVYLAGGAIQNLPSTPIYNYSGIVCNGYPNCTAPLRTITFTLPSYVTPYCPTGQFCTMIAYQLMPGTYDLAVGNDTYGKSNTVPFTVTGAASGSLNITAVDAPNSLPLGAPGTWTVHATTSLSGTLHYSVNWGDQSMATSSGIMAPTTGTIQASASFSHAYSYAGRYTPTFTVTDDYGHTVSSSVSIQVTPLY